MAQEALVSLELAVLDMTQDSSRFFAGLDDLMDGKLSLELVEDASLEAEFSQLRRELTGRGFDLVFQGHAQVYQLPATFVQLNQTVQILVKVPVIPASDVAQFHLFQHLALPVLHEDYLVQVRAREEMIAINSDRSQFVALSGAEIDACTKVGYMFLCPYVSLTSQGGPGGCLKSIFMGEAEIMERACQVEFLKSDFMVTRVNDTAFQMFSRGLRSVSVTCDGVTERARLEGMKIVDVEPGCIAFVEGRTFLSALKPSATVDSIVTAFPEEFLVNWNCLLYTSDAADE